MQNKINNLSDTVDELKDEFKEAKASAPEKYVRMNHFQSIVDPIQEQISDIQRDIKSILMIVSHNEKGIRSSRKASD